MSATTYKPPRVQPLAAARALKNLLKDPQDTRQVALLTSALRGRSGQIQYNRFKTSPNGARILAEKRRLGDVLDNHAYLATLPENSLGRRYLAFMAEENLSAKGLKDVTAEATANLKDAGEDVMIFADRTRDLHDLYHVIAGYGRDEIGELSVLAFSYPQQRLRSYAVIAFFGALNFSNLLARHKIGARYVFGAIAQAYRHGKQAAWLPGEDIEALLPENIETLRRRLNIAPPDKYQALIERIRAKTAWRNGPLFAGRRLLFGGPAIHQTIASPR
jgi:ubiquinone biosynthesis protein COQ4